jgi:hypothetical protein
MISNNYSLFLWQQGSINTAFSANQDTTIAVGAYDIHSLTLELTFYST